MKSKNIFDDEYENQLEKSYNKFMMKYRNKIDKYIIYKKQRWVLTLLILALYIIRISSIGGFYVVSYVVGLYIMHLAVQFFTPVGIPDIEDDQDDCDIQLPTFINETQDQRGPLLRSMSEFNFWQRSTFVIIFGFMMTFSEVFNLPVFWPFLLGYFLLLFVLTVKRQFRHMAKYKYNMDDFTMKSKK